MTVQRIAALLTCHNRREKTVACLRSLESCDVPEGFALHVFVVDDGSTDGTAEAIREQHPPATVIRGDGQLFWTGGMRLAMDAAVQADFEFLLWLNDDVLLSPDAVHALLDTYSRVTYDPPAEAIIVGSTHGAQSDRVTYGGLVEARGVLPDTLVLVQPGAEPREVFTMNGNCVLVPSSVAGRVGSLDGAFTHGLSDWDYGLRARKMGVKIYICPGFVGTCDRNAQTELPEGARSSITAQLASMSDKKRLPYREWLRYTRRHSPLCWPVNWARPYAAATVRAVRWKWREQAPRLLRAIRAKRD
jgi:GT2 family glycosyltransferase